MLRRPPRSTRTDTLFPYTTLFRSIDDATAQAFATLVQRRVAGEPVAYLLGTRGFWRFDLAVTADTLIPRPETELLVELALQRLPEQSQARAARSEERRVGKECVSTCRSRWAQYH